MASQFFSLITKYKKMPNHFDDIFIPVNVISYFEGTSKVFDGKTMSVLAY